MQKESSQKTDLLEKIASKRDFLLIENFIGEVEPSEINLSSFKPKRSLNEKIWVNGKINSNVRLRLLDISDDFLDTIELKFKPVDVVIMGSIANYNWSKFSDIDLHIIADYGKLYKDKDVLIDYLGAKKNEWNENHGNLKIYGFPVELYVQDVKDKVDSAAVYSLYKNKWLKEPTEIEENAFDHYEVKRVASKIMTLIDKLEEKYHATNDTQKMSEIGDKSKALFSKVRGMRKDSLAKEGEMGMFNIVYKVLRRSGYLDKLYELKLKTYDKINSIR